MKRLILILMLLPLLSFSQMKDSDKHKIAGNVISLGIGAITYELTDKPFLSIGVGFGAGVLAGILKEEVYDKRMKKGVYSEQDMIDTGWGAVVGSIMVSVYIGTDRDKRITKFE